MALVQSISGMAARKTLNLNIFGANCKQFLKKTKKYTDMNTTIKFTRVNNDPNGNGRLVCHFFNLMLDSEKNEDWHIDRQYLFALKRAKKIGGKKFHNKQYGGGIVFQSDNEFELENKIINLIKNII